jgi:hypothetical protein
MKKISILFLLIVFSLTKVNSQEKNFFSLDIFALLSGVLNISYEKMLSETETTIYSFSYSENSTADEKISGIELKIGSHVFPSKKSFRGFFAGPIGTLGYVSADKSELNSFYVGAGGEIGYRWLKKRGFTFGINLLISYILGEITFEKATASFVGLNYELNAKVGYVW